LIHNNGWILEENKINEKIPLKRPAGIKCSQSVNQVDSIDIDDGS
jgi:hypothetical protein